MVFSSLVFLSVFLPAVLILYSLSHSVRIQNVLLLIASLVFYAYGEPVYVFLMIITAFLNYLWALLIQMYQARRRLFLILSVIESLGFLGIFKYAGFLAETLNACTGLHVPVPELALPIGISFFTFQAMSYVIDVYREDVKAEKSFTRVLLYISFFPQLIAGPIVKYHDVALELANRRQSLPEVSEGIRRFIVGLGKKILIANYMGVIADTLFSAQAADINILNAWLGAAAYMLQIYFDFSGYSDMAIGLGWMFGFHFKENFQYPYTSLSIREFWRRWHISLSSWFREYLYIPLGGNRKGRIRTCINKFIVFTCTGIWHGANVTFLFWGLYHGFFLMLEEYLPFFKKQEKKKRNIAGHIYVLLVVLTGFVFFRADNMAQGFFWIREMFFGFHFELSAMQLCLSLLNPVHITAFAAGIIASVPIKNYFMRSPRFQNASWVLSMIILLFCMMNLAGGTYNPFIYFRF